MAMALRDDTDAIKCLQRTSYAYSNRPQTIAEAIREPAIDCKPTQLRKIVIHVPW